MNLDFGRYDCHPVCHYVSVDRLAGVVLWRKRSYSMSTTTRRAAMARARAKAVSLVYIIILQLLLEQEQSTLVGSSLHRVFDEEVRRFTGDILP